MFMKEPHTALFVAPTGVGKTHLALSLLETEYRNHFDFIVIICPTLRYNSTYKSRGWVWNDPDLGKWWHIIFKTFISQPNFFRVYL